MTFYVKVYETLTINSPYAISSCNYNFMLRGLLQNIWCIFYWPWRNRLNLFGIFYNRLLRLIPVIICIRARVSIVWIIVARMIAPVTIRIIKLCRIRILGCVLAICFWSTSAIVRLRHQKPFPQRIILGRRISWKYMKHYVNSLFMHQK